MHSFAVSGCCFRAKEGGTASTRCLPTCFRGCGALAAAALGADGFLYLSDPLILLERERDPARVRLTAFENEAACASCLREAGLAGSVLTLPPDCPAELRQLAERLVKGDE